MDRRPKATAGVSTSQLRRGRYALAPAEVHALRDLSRLIRASVTDMSVDVDRRAVARAMGTRPVKLAALLDAADIADDQVEAVAARPGHLRRKRRSTLVKLCVALGLAEAAAERVADLWIEHVCMEHAPDAAFAPEKGEA